MRSPVQKQYGSLKTLTLEGTPGGPAVVFFHGYGADASDLLPLADMMGLGPTVTWIFPAAPMQVIIAPGFHGKAWFAIDSKRLENSLTNGEPLDMSKTTPPGLDNARKQAISLFDDVSSKHSKVVVGGFSQGAMLSVDLALTHTKKPAGLVIMSGTLICEDQWKKLVPSCAGLSFIQSHGKNDALLGYEFGERLFEVLNEGDMHGDFLGFNGGHEIPPKVIEKIGQYLRGICKPGR